VKNLIVANCRPTGKTREPELRALIQAQLENSRELGWAPEDLYVVTNLNVEGEANIIRCPLNETCLTGSKMFALQYLFDQRLIQENDVWWAHDLDAWQNHPFTAPEFLDIGLAEYSTEKFNGGSIFLRGTARDLIFGIVSMIHHTRGLKEEPAINQILRSPLCRHRVSTLNSTYNVGCSAYAIRYHRSIQPILVSHFHPTGSTSWRTHVDGVNPLGIPSVSPRLVDLLQRHFHHGQPPNFPPKKPGKDQS
jgi:hypothetical protein